MQLNIEELKQCDDTTNNHISNNNIFFNIESCDLENYCCLENYNLENTEDERLSQIVNYTLNYTVKDLIKICEYYKTDKFIKSNKYNKEAIIHHIVAFEFDLSNKELVDRRKMLWICINELKNDKYMKKYVIW